MSKTAKFLLITFVVIVILITSLLFVKKAYAGRLPEKKADPNSTNTSGVKVLNRKLEIKNGIKGPEAKALQSLMNEIILEAEKDGSISPGEYKLLTLDGDAGSKTIARMMVVFGVSSVNLDNASLIYPLIYKQDVWQSDPDYNSNFDPDSPTGPGLPFYTY